MTETRSGAARLLEAVKFAADQHRFQTRKGEESSPYINHPIDVAELLARVGGVTDEDVLVAALLHDTVEDTGATPEQLEAMFGARVRSLVLEVTDDKSLPKEERKRLQVEHAAHLSPGARHIKLCDKISNIRDVANDPPAGWPLERRVAYLQWADDVVAKLRGTNAALEALFDQTLTDARAKVAAPGDA